MYSVKRCAIFLGIVLVLNLPLPSSSQNRTVTEILNACYDSVNDVLRASRWAGSPSSGLTPAQIFNNVYVPAAGDSEAYMRFMEEIRGATPPATCEASVELFAAYDGARCICNNAGDGWNCGEGAGEIVTTLCNLTDVDCTVTPEVGQVLTMGEDNIAVFAASGAGVSTLDALTDVDVTTPPTDGQALVFDDSDDHWKPGALPAGTVAGLTDVDVTTPPADEQVLTWETSTSKWTPKAVPGAGVGLTLNDLTDVTLGTPSNGHALIYDSSVSQWESTAIPGLPPVITGQGLRLTPVVETTTCDMTRSIHKITPTATTTCTLPIATDTAKPSYYQFFIMNANGVAIAPTSTNLINGVNATMATVTGPLASITCHNLDDLTAWQCAVTTLAGYGSALSTLCVDTGGGTNNSSIGFGTDIPHDVSCAIPTGKLTENSVLKVCSLWELTTGATPPTLILKLKADAVTLAAMPTPGQTLQATIGAGRRIITTCYSTVVGAISSGTSRNFFTGPVSAMNGFGSGSFAVSDVDQPTPVNVAGEVIITQTSQFPTTGTGTTTIQQLAMTVEASGLLP